MAFEMVCEKVDIIPTIGVFFSFFITKLTKGSYVTLSNRQAQGVFIAHSNNYKRYKDKSVQVRGREDSFGMLDSDGVPLFL